MSPVLSVVIPTRDRERRLARALASVQGQTITDIEILVVDDASTDDTAALLAREAAADPRIRVITNAVSVGGAAARNRALAVASGEHLGFCDDDDEWLPSKAERQLAHLAEHPALGLVGCWSELVDARAGDEPVAYRGPVDIDHADLLWDNFIGSASFAIVRRSALGPGEPFRFDERFRAFQDWELWLRISEHCPVAVLPEPLCRYHAHEDARITRSPDAVLAARRLLVARHAAEMPATVRAYHRARLALDDPTRGPVDRVRVLASTTPRVLWLLAAASIVGRSGWHRDDPAAGSARLHRAVHGRR
ncbi:MAG: glycosyltransferase involved in cell wall biosis [Acidimicrobiales bacterium]|jgi:glycosyltransferase involved in cell wall biosynthesis|nr:glycosyltransferase involved in cell wall biosis [Acidimicrobiales bacterium]